MPRLSAFDREPEGENEIFIMYVAFYNDCKRVRKQYMLAGIKQKFSNNSMVASCVYKSLILQNMNMKSLKFECLG